MAEEGIKGWHIMLILLGIGGALGALMLYLTTRQGQGGQGQGGGGGGTSATLHLGYNLQMIPDIGRYYTTLRYRVYDYYMNVLLYENLTDLAMDGLNWRQDVIFATLGYKKFAVVYEYLDDWNRVLWNMTKQGLYDGDSYIIDIPNTRLIKRSSIT
jgi:hypothetical protein